MKNPTTYWRSIGAIVGVILGGLVVPALVLAQAVGNPTVVPLERNTFGNPYSEWSARWWQWALSIPAAENPLLDTTGAHCAEGQGGQVWFLAGTFGGTATRNCTVPGDKALFFPILNAAFGNGVGDCTGPSDCEVTALRVSAAAAVDNPKTLRASIDGRPVKHLSQFRVTSPVFSAFLPVDNVLDQTPGTYEPLVADGYWLLLQPLSPGVHTIHFKGVSNTDFQTEVIYNLTVTE